MQVDIATKEDLEALKSALLDEFKKIVSEKNTQLKRWLRTKEVRKEFNISQNSLQNLRAKGILHPKRLGGILYYDREQIESVLKSS